MKDDSRVGGNGGGFTTRVGDLTGRATDEMQDLRERIDQLNDRVVGFIRARPGTAVVAALLGGFLVGRILRA